MHHFVFTLRTPEFNLFEGKVVSVALTTEGGDLQIFANHASLTGSILFSTIKVMEDHKEEIFLARNGIVSFDNVNNKASLLAMYCEKRSEMNIQTAKEYLRFIVDRLAKGESLSEFQIHHLEGEKVAIEEQIKQVN